MNLPKKSSFRERVHRYSALPVKDLLRTRMNELGMDNVTLARSLGYAKPNVIAMMKMGDMRLPDSKAVAAARALELDPAFLLGKVISENNAELWSSIESAMGDKLITEAEFELVGKFRELLNGFDVNLTKNADFMAAATEAVAKVLATEVAKLNSNIARLDQESARRKKPGPADPESALTGA